MGGSGSGRKPGKNADLEPESTLLEGGDADPGTEKIKPKAGKAGGKKFTVAEIREKIDLLFAGVAGILGREYTYSEGDFDGEAHGVVRLAEKYPVIHYVLSLIDPVLVVLGLYKKFARLGKKEKQAEKSPDKTGNVVTMAR